jgi:hypothetical protein
MSRLYYLLVQAILHKPIKNIFSQSSDISRAVWLTQDNFFTTLSRISLMNLLTAGESLNLSTNRGENL